MLHRDLPQPAGIFEVPGQKGGIHVVRLQAQLLWAVWLLPLRFQPSLAHERDPSNPAVMDYDFVLCLMPKVEYEVYTKSL